MDRNEQLAFLERCLENGALGREQWNRHRAAPDQLGLELIQEPLTMTLSDGVRVSLSPPNLWLVDLRGADLTGYDLSGAFLSGARLQDAVLRDSDLSGAHLIVTDFRGADLKGADLSRANLLDADLTNADLTQAELVGTLLLRTTVDGATLDGCTIHGVSAWGLRGEPRSQRDLKITTMNEPTITVDDVEVGQFVYLMLHNEKIRSVIDTIGERGVLLLGRFGDRKPVLEKLRTRLRELGFAPIIFDFEKPATKTLTETVRVLAGLCAFVLADITDRRSVPQEAMAVIPTSMVPFVPIIQLPQKPWAMLTALWQEHPDRVLEPLPYQGIDQLLPRLRNAVVEPALEQRKALLARRAEEMGIRSIQEIALDSDIADSAIEL